MNSTSLTWDRIAMALALGPVIAGWIMLEDGASTPLGAGVALVGVLAFGVGLAPSWRRARRRAADAGESRARRSFSDMPLHLRVPLGLMAALLVLVAAGTVAAAVSLPWTDVPGSFVAVLSVTTLVYAGGTWLVWRLGTRPTAARRHLEQEVRAHSDTRRQVLGVATGFAALGAGWLAGLAVRPTSAALAYVTAAVVAATAALVAQWIDAREVRRVLGAGERR